MVKIRYATRLLPELYCIFLYIEASNNMALNWAEFIRLLFSAHLALLLVSSFSHHTEGEHILALGHTLAIVLAIVCYQEVPRAL